MRDSAFLAYPQRRGLCVASHGTMEMGSESDHRPFHMLAWDLWCVPLDNAVDFLWLIG